MLHGRYARGMSMVWWWYEHYVGCTSITRSLHEREDVCRPDYQFVRCGLWGVVEKLGKEIGQPVKAGHNCLGIASVGG